MRAVSKRYELAGFLRARRAARSPEEAGLQRIGRRLTPGLRREEVAALAGIGVAWYSWLEQGRVINVSAQVLRRISGALDLSRIDEDYLFSLMGLSPPLPTPPRDSLPAPLLKAMSLYHGPVYVIDHLFYVLGYNRLGGLLWSMNDADQGFARNHLWRAFMQPERRALYGEAFESNIGSLLGVLRLNASTRPDDERYHALVAELTAGSEDFRAMWKQHSLNASPSWEEHVMHPVHGDLHVHGTRVSLRETGLSDATIHFFVPADVHAEQVFADLMSQPDQS